MDKTTGPNHLMNRFRLEGNVAVVTGGCQNFGFEIATGLAECGADLAITSRSGEKAERVAGELQEALGVRALGVELEITSEASVVAAFKRVHAHYGRIDVLVNNAGGHAEGSSGNTISLSCG